jgi:hypothetical protein
VASDVVLDIVEDTAVSVTGAVVEASVAIVTTRDLASALPTASVALPTVLLPVLAVLVALDKALAQVGMVAAKAVLVADSATIDALATDRVAATVSLWVPAAAAADHLPADIKTVIATVGMMIRRANVVTMATVTRTRAQSVGIEPCVTHHPDIQIMRLLVTCFSSFDISTTTLGSPTAYIITDTSLLLSSRLFKGRYEPGAMCLLAAWHGVEGKAR